MTRVLRGRKSGQIEHQVGDSYTGERPDDLTCEVGRDVRPRESALACDGERHRRIEMRPRDRPEREDERDERGARRERIGEQRHGDVPAGEPLAHDPGPDDGREQKRGSEPLRRAAPREYGRSAFALVVSRHGRS